MNKTLKNIFYVFLQQLVNTILPFLTIPYIARVLGVEQNGIFAYSLTIVNLFAVFFAFGFAVHGANIIAQSKGKDRNITYIELQVLRIFFLLIGCLLYLILLNFYSIPYSQTIFLLQGIIILSFVFDNSWYYQGTGEFKKIVTRNIMVKLIGTLSVFIFVKNPEDLWIYILLINGSQLLGNIILFQDTLGLFKLINQVRIQRLIYHFNVSFFLFLPNISVLIYTSFDRILLGSVGDIEGLANYQHVQRIITFAYAFLMIVSPVLIQKIATQRSNNLDKEANFIIRKGLNIYLLLGLFIISVISLTSKEIIMLFLGPDYQQAVYLFIILSPILLFKSLGAVIGGWYLVPLGRNKLHSLPLVIGTIISIILNLIITPHIGVLAAATIFVLTELIIITIQLIYSKEVFLFFEKSTHVYFLIIFLVSFLVTNLVFTTEKMQSDFFGLTLKILFFSFISVVFMFILKKTRLFIIDYYVIIRER